MIDAYITLISILIDDDRVERANAYITLFIDYKPRLLAITTDIDYINDVINIQCKTIDVKERRPFEYDCKEHTVLNSSNYTDQIILIPEWIEYNPNKVAQYVQKKTVSAESHWNSKIITTTVITANRLINHTTTKSHWNKIYK